RMAPPALPGREPSAGLRVDGLVQQVKQLRAEAKQLQAKNAWAVAYGAPNDDATELVAQAQDRGDGT
ncbi:hypothetical protein ABZX95_50115, partial [Streptomyces sp. NPDC004232]|uniref:hypothetical protein n=1 Tax=Streptomyces sp. NPDC004232 TaxID=3154454 RepID=UPI0033BBACBE